ncbi:MAG TPA: hypothetical protein PLG15_00300 [Candidatus Gastranaerophilaceae bacterium]|nr:hypothetical protein [Candidatus Gastranaerophilaceae bacterium]HPT40807.1 hypothetical protein [Candidatus Gastranaerophilaceae bacterium]
MQVRNISPEIINKNINKTSQNPSFGNILTKSRKAVLDLFEPGRAGEMGMKLFVINAYVFLLSGRLLSSRDKKGEKTQKETAMDYIRNNNEKRETIIRDVPTILLAVMGVPWIEKFVSKRLQKSQGFAIHDIQKDKLGNIIPKYQVGDWYIFDKNLKTGFKGFTQRLADMGGNLHKIYSHLDEGIKDKIKGFSLQNDEFMNQLFADKELTKEVETAFSNPGNKAFRQAGFLKALPKVFGFVSTLLLIGILIPKFNIFITEMLHKGKKQEVAQENKDNNQKPAEQKQTSTNLLEHAKNNSNTSNVKPNI